MEPIKIFDAFAGIGALETAFEVEQIPHTVACMSEIDLDAIVAYGAMRKVYEQPFEFPDEETMRNFCIERNIGFDFKTNRSKIPKLKLDKLKKVYQTSVVYNNFGDISTLKPEELPDFDFFNVSFPCTSISAAGFKDGIVRDKTASGLIFYSIDIIKVKKPKYLLIENVKNLIKPKFINDFNLIISEIEKLGYNCYFHTNNGKPEVLNATHFQIPQARERIIVICIRKDIDTKTFVIDSGTEATKTLLDILEPQVDEKYYFDENYYKGWNVFNPVAKSKSQILKIKEHSSHQQHRRIYDPNGPSPTILASQGGATTKIELNGRIRKLTSKECWRLFGFSDELYELAAEHVSQTGLGKLAGNSIVVPMLSAQLKRLFKQEA